MKDSETAHFEFAPHKKVATCINLPRLSGINFKIAILKMAYLLYN